jgi:hypothetical protein
MVADQTSAREVLLRFGPSALQRLEFAVREEHAKQTVAFPVDVDVDPDGDDTESSSGDPSGHSLRLVNNLPLGVLILGQTSRPSFGGGGRK